MTVTFHFSAKSLSFLNCTSKRGLCKTKKMREKVVHKRNLMKEFIFEENNNIDLVFMRYDFYLGMFTDRLHVFLVSELYFLKSKAVIYLHTFFSSFKFQ